MNSDLVARLDRLKQEHAALMQRLYEAISKAVCGKRWEDMSDDDCITVVSAAGKLCRQWDENVALREGYAMGASKAVNLVARERHVAQQILDLEEQLSATRR